MNLSTEPRVVLGSNIFVSAIVWNGVPEKVIDLWLEDKFTLYISPEILLETLLVLNKFQVPEKIVSRLKVLIETHAEKFVPKSNFAICRDKKDNKFLNLCFDCQASYLVTGDKDLLVLKKFKNTKIVSPKKFLEIIQST